MSRFPDVGSLALLQGQLTQMEASQAEEALGKCVPRAIQSKAQGAQRRCQRSLPMHLCMPEPQMEGECASPRRSPGAPVENQDFALGAFFVDRGNNRKGCVKYLLNKVVVKLTLLCVVC